MVFTIGKDTKIDCIVSVGTGAFSEKKQGKTLKDLMLSVIECATSTERVDEIMMVRFLIFLYIFILLLNEL